MPYVVANRRLSAQTLARRYGEAPVLDLTSKGPLPWRRFSPFYPHGGIPIPFSPGRTAMSVEGIWQGLKVFETTNSIDTSKFAVTDMKNLKRTTRVHGPLLGHQFGVDDTRLLRYLQARWLIYLPSYRWVLEHRLTREVDRLAALGKNEVVVLLDYTTNGDPDDPSSVLSHAALVARYLTGDWPTRRRATNGHGGAAALPTEEGAA